MAKPKETIIYETVAPGGATYRYEYSGNYVSIYVNGKLWGSPQGDRFILALLRDIQNGKKCLCNE